MREMIDSRPNGQLFRWTSAILLGALVLFSIAKPRIELRLNEIQQRTFFQNGNHRQTQIASERSPAYNSGSRQVGALSGIQVILFIAFLVTWILGLYHLRSGGNLKQARIDQ